MIKYLTLLELGDTMFQLCFNPFDWRLGLTLGEVDHPYLYAVGYYVQLHLLPMFYLRTVTWAKRK